MCGKNCDMAEPKQVKLYTNNNQGETSYNIICRLHFIDYTKCKKLAENYKCLLQFTFLERLLKCKPKKEMADIFKGKSIMQLSLEDNIEQKQNMRSIVDLS